MLRRRLTFALAALAAAAVLEGLVALWALGVAEHKLQRGRVVSDIQLGFVELSATKQRLRSWVAQWQLQAGAETAERDRLLALMASTLQRLQQLSVQAAALAAVDTSDATEPIHPQRQQALQVLSRSLQELERELQNVQPLQAGTDARAAWLALNNSFDLSQGTDLRGLLTQSIAREAAAVAQERDAANATLGWMRVLWLTVALTLALGALLMAAYFTRALRRPLDRLSAGAQALQRGDLSHRIAADGADEFAAVAHSVNAMAAELAQRRSQEARLRQELEALVQARTLELQSALQALRDVDARRRQLFADISHELRTPTTAIRGEAEITLRGRDKPVQEYQAALQRITDTARQLGLVIDDLLTMARSDIDTLALDRQPLDLAQPLTEALAQASALARQRNITLQAEPLPAQALPLLADPQRLRQLLSLLLDNAVRYSHPGGLVRTRVSRLDGPEPSCWVEVSDAGIGIPPEELPHVFERNFRGVQARLHRADGSGLGLAIGVALARAHGGEITLHSQPGQGTTARLRLPLRRATAPAQNVTAANPSAARPEALSSRPA